MGLILVAGLVMLWRGSLRRSLGDSELDAFLDPGAGDRDTYHAVEEISRRIARNDESRKRFYPKVIALASSPHPEKRKAAAWGMGEDPKDESFRVALTRLIEDPVPLVAQNAALALVRHGSNAGRPVLLAMLAPMTVTAPAEGAFKPKVKVGETADINWPLAMIATASGEVPVDTPIPGRVLTLAADGAKVAKGETVATLSAAQSSALEALRALTLPGIGRPEDVGAIEAFLGATPDLESKVEDQARQAILALRRG
jgi:hypothetical protein